ncbi:ABC transporter substrate-binding protein [Virgibacillus sp. NKC19-3]|uniref:ABC transporter substrate-binding protein n=1 Tax=Virgibacillus saliphilus TaxID=2831674 RepID=UPI001C9B9CD3|nr:ABC transporter substrate-binding protein [Virgibacillus sp. NKC19-3]MBY7142837.1 ABC transporter substrate-binding protein [Virgibacillus sp. NKC19-3]
MKKLIVLIALVLIIAGCSGNSSETTTTEDGKTVISFWHNLDGDNAVTLEGIIDNFNEQSDTVEVNASFQDDVQQQMRTVGATDSAPEVFMGGNTAYYSQSGFIRPIEEMIDEDSDFDISTMNEAVISNHSLDETLYSMPFNVFVPLLFYNVEIFEEAGVDPDNPPQTFSEIQEAAGTLTAGDVYGFSIPLDTSFIYNFFAVQNELVFNNDNGRLGEEPSETNLNTPTGQNIYNWINEMNENGHFGNYGREWSNMQLAFSSGELAMYPDSSAVTGIWLETLDFEFQTAPLPVPDGEEWAGVNQGGSQLWLSNQGTEEEQEAGWEFIKFMVSAETQSEWAASTGYVPVTQEAVEIDPLNEAYNENEQLKEAYDALNNTNPSEATAGPSIEQLEVSEAIAQSFERLVQGEDIESLLEETESEINELLQK